MFFGNIYVFFVASKFHWVIGNVYLFVASKIHQVTFCMGSCGGSLKMYIFLVLQLISIMFVFLILFM